MGIKVSQAAKRGVRGVPEVERSLGDPRGLRGTSGVYHGFRGAPRIYNKKVAFCKICFPNFARDKWSDHNFENCSEITPVTRIRKMWVQSQILRH